MLSPRRTVALFAAATLIGWAGTAAARPRPFHRHQKDQDGEVTNHYSDRGAKPAKVKLPQVTLRSRALLGKDGGTTVEISTAPFDVGATPLGNISHVHIDAIDADGHGKDDDKDHKKLKFHKEYDHLHDGGYVSWKYTGLPHGQGLRIEAKATGAVHREEAEVRMADVVHYRPDLAVRDLAVPPTAAPGTAVFISGTVIERMGDLGGTADCVLLVDGAQVDVNPNIWVAASGDVTCSMAASFTAGKHTVTLRAQNVRPGDYDDSNNELSGSIDVRNAVNVSYDAYASEHTQEVYSARDDYVTSTSTTPEQHSATDNKVYDQSRSMMATVPLAVALPFSVSFADKSGGNALSRFAIDKPDLQSVPVDDPSSWTEQRTFSQDDGNGNVITITRYFNSGTSAGSTTVSFSLSATEANYHSESWCKSTVVFQCSAGDFTTASDAPSGSGTKVQLADDYTVDLTVNDGSAYKAHAQVPLATFGSTVPTTTTNCFNTRFPQSDGTIGKRCITTSVTDFGKSGEVATPF